MVLSLIIKKNGDCRIIWCFSYSLWQIFPCFCNCKKRKISWKHILRFIIRIFKCWKNEKIWRNWFILLFYLYLFSFLSFFLSFLFFYLFNLLFFFFLISFLSTWKGSHLKRFLVFFTFFHIKSLLAEFFRKKKKKEWPEKGKNVRNNNNNTKYSF